MKKHAINAATSRRLTFAEQMASLATEASNRAFSRAQELNALAKSARGYQRQLLYLGKHRILRSLVERGLVMVSIDDAAQVGLLSVKAPNGLRLHTSDAWLDAAVKRELADGSRL